VQVGFETLRWTCAVRDFRNGMPEEQLRQKLGLSKISWRETSEKFTNWPDTDARERGERVTTLSPPAPHPTVDPFSHTKRTGV
jgi:hypothetical protein